MKDKEFDSRRSSKLKELSSLGQQYFIYFEMFLDFENIYENACTSVIYFTPKEDAVNIEIGTPAVHYCPDGLIYFTIDGTPDRTLGGTLVVPPDDGAMLNKTFVGDQWYRVLISQLLVKTQVSN